MCFLSGAIYAGTKMFIMLITEMRDKILPRKHRFCDDISDTQAHVFAEEWELTQGP